MAVRLSCFSLSLIGALGACSARVAAPPRPVAAPPDASMGAARPDAAAPLDMSAALTDLASAPPDLADSFVDPGDTWIIPSGVNIAATPPMGWNSWNTFQCGVSDAIVRAAADALVTSGMSAAGYEFVNIDDCWADHRDAQGNIVAAAAFPSGMKAVADYIHGKGLKAGIYTTVGDQTCAGRPGSRNHTAQDANAYAAWGMDYAKIDWCGLTGDAATAWGEWRDALSATQRRIVFSICSAGRFDPWNWAPQLGNLWRTTDDINANDWNWIMNIVEINEPLAALAHPGAWNDPDMLEVGNGSLSDTQNRTHFSLWAMMAAPLIAGNDLRNMPDAVRTILTNTEVIAVDQDPLGYQGYRARQDGTSDLWFKPLQGSGVRAVALVNHSSTAAAQIAFKWVEIGLADGAATVRDLWEHTDLGSFQSGYSATVPPEGTVVLKVTGAPPPLPRGATFLSDLVWTYAASYWGPVERDMSNGEKLPGDGHSLSIAGQTYAKGLGSHAGSLIRYRLGGRCSSFSGAVGVDDEVPRPGSVTFEIWSDGTRRFHTGVMKKGDAAAPFTIDVSGVNELKLLTTNAQDGYDSDHADWVNVQVTCAP
jgi:alpha-galactosidase